MLWSGVHKIKPCLRAWERLSARKRSIGSGRMSNAVCRNTTGSKAAFASRRTPRKKQRPQHSLDKGETAMKKLVTTTPDPEFNIPDSERPQKEGKPKEPPRPPGVGWG